MTGMTWDSYRSFIERNKSSSAIFRYYKKGEKMSICDFGLPRRKGMIQTAIVAHNEQDNWYQNSFVCNVGYLDGGYVPMFNNQSIYDDKTEKWVKLPVRGVIPSLHILLGSGCLEKTDELAELLRRYGKKHIDSIVS